MIESDIDECVLFFARYPLPGQVKSRLAAKVGQDVACELYKNFVFDMLDMLGRVGYEHAVMVHPGESCEKFSKLFGGGRKCFPQRGADLGERMRNALLQAFDSGYRKAVLIGSDLPDLPEDVIVGAFDALESHDAVVGPAGDGGYYLIGFTPSGMLPVAFNDMPWGTAEVFDRTVEVLRANGRRVHLLCDWNDIDTVEDLDELVQRNMGCRGDLRTISYILDKKLLPVDDKCRRGEEHA